METIRFTDNSGKKRRGIQKQCEICNKSFIVELRFEKQKCCSNTCKGKLKTEESKIECRCALCGKICYKTLGKLKNSKSGLYFCNRKCKDNAQKIGGVKEIMPAHYGTGNSRFPISNCYKYGIEVNECSDCKEYRLYLLCVHHIDGNSKNNNKQNIEIVCYNCHAKRHMELIEGKWQINFKKLTPREDLYKL